MSVSDDVTKCNVLRNCVMLPGSVIGSHLGRIFDCCSGCSAFFFLLERGDTGDWRQETGGSKLETGDQR